MLLYKQFTAKKKPVRLFCRQTYIYEKNKLEKQCTKNVVRNVLECVRSNHAWGFEYIYIFVFFYYFFFFSEAQLISKLRDLACFRYLGIFQRSKILFIFHNHESYYCHLIYFYVRLVPSACDYFNREKITVVP